MTFEQIVEHYATIQPGRVVYRRSDLTDEDERKSSCSCLLGNCLCKHDPTSRCPCGKWRGTWRDKKNWWGSKSYPSHVLPVLRASGLVSAMKPRDLMIGDVVQLSPTMEDSFFSGCFMMVTEPKTWGAVGFISIPGERGTIPARAYTRVEWANMEYVGGAIFIPADEA